jgi:hypothetical protein
MIRFLKVLRAAGRVLLVLAGAFFVVTGLASLPKLFLGIGLVVAGILLHVGLTAALRRRDPAPYVRLLPGGRPDANVLARFFRQPEVYVVLFGFLLNFWWEVSQVPFYLGINRGRPYFGENTVAMKWFFVTTFWRASLLDALLVLGAFLVAGQVYQDRYWFVRGGRLFGRESGVRLPAWAGYALVTLVCVAFLVYLEISAFDSGLWGYSPIMPTLFTKIGVVPVAALLVTPTVILLLARRVILGFDLRPVTIRAPKRGGTRPAPRTRRR